MSTSDQNDSLEEVLRQLQNAPNDQRVWEDMFRLTAPFVRALCHRALPAQRRVVDVDDVTQEVFLKFFRYLLERKPRISDRDTLFALLAVISRQLASDAVRWQSRARRDVHREQTSVPELSASSTRSAEKDVQTQDLLDIICQSLYPIARTILGMRLQGYTESDIAPRLKFSTRTVERHMKSIREIVEPYFSLSELERGGN